MKKIHINLINIAICSLVLMATALTACSDDIPAESLYTYKTDMMSDYLRKNERFSEFAKIVEKAGKMDLLGTYGTYTCFAPTNEAVKTYLQSVGLSSVDELSVEDCDTITRTAIVDRIYYLIDLDGRMNLPQNNMLGNSLMLEPVQVAIESEDVDGHTKIDSVVTYRINRSGLIVYTLANDSVENGVIQPVDGLVATSTLTLPLVMKEDKSISLFNLCLEMTGLAAEMHRIQDLSFNPRYWREKKKMEGLYPTGAQEDYCHVPDQRNYGYTAFAVPDEILEKEYNITDWKGLYKYGCEKYYPGLDLDENDPVYGTSPTSLTNPLNPLRKLISYHLLDRKGLYDKLFTFCSIYCNDINPIEWYSTMNPHSTLKVEYISEKNVRFRSGEEKLNNLYLNHCYDRERPGMYQRGAMISKTVNEGLTQIARNGVYYYIDRLIDYGEKTQNTVFNCRMRMDLYSLFPEMMNNDFRTDKTDGGGKATEDPTADAKNFIFPPGYLDNVDMDEDGDFFLQNCRNYFWSYEGDEFNLRSDNNSYDITFPLPSVPTGQYQIRLGFTAMARRGIAQFYVDGVPQGIPLDMRQTNLDAFHQRIGGWKALDDASIKNNDEAREQMKKNMHNKGWYHGPRSFRTSHTSSNHQSAVKNDKLLSTSNSDATCNAPNIVRKVIYEGPLDGNIQHTMRIRSVLAIGGAELMLDYLEFVPKSVYGIEEEGKGEDDL
ncbi:MAG: fasciclin domain-containing protein [Bacteroidaceae bacterium]|nr:fasciclin domain-containing protein [Bacteroidaceae bacterium]